MLATLPRGATKESLKQLGRYTLIARIGTGGMADVHLALQGGLRGFKKLVVLKLIHSHLAVNPQFVSMLLDEARIAAQLKHPNVVDIYDADCVENKYFIAMEYLAGQPLTNLIVKGRKTRKLDPYSTSRIIADAAAALDAAHSMRSIAGEPLELVHRDVSPGNVMVLYDGSVKLVDFGVAKARGQLEEGGHMKMVPGKIGYAAPEQLEGQTVDRRADIFGLGVVFWESLAHKRLFPGENRSAVLEKMATWRPIPPSYHRPDVPSELDEICLRMLQMKPENRFPSAKDLNRELEQFLREANYYREASTISDYMAAMFAEERRVIESLAGEVFRDSEALPQGVTRRPLVMLEARSLLGRGLDLTDDDRDDSEPVLPVDGVIEPADSRIDTRLDTQIVPAAREIEARRVKWKTIGIAGVGVAALIVIAGVLRGAAGSQTRAPGAAPPAQSDDAPWTVATEPEPVARPKPERVARPKPEPVARPEPEPVARPEPEPVTRPEPEPVVESPEEQLAKRQAARAAAQRLYREGVRLMATGSLEQARRQLKRALKKDPEIAAAYRGLGMIYEKEGSRSAAKRAYKRYLRSAPRARDAAAIRARLESL